MTMREWYARELEWSRQCQQNLVDLPMDVAVDRLGDSVAHGVVVTQPGAVTRQRESHTVSSDCQRVPRCFIRLSKSDILFEVTPREDFFERKSAAQEVAIVCTYRIKNMIVKIAANILLISTSLDGRLAIRKLLNVLDAFPIDHRQDEAVIWAVTEFICA